MEQPWHNGPMFCWWWIQATTSCFCLLGFQYAPGFNADNLRLFPDIETLEMQEFIALSEAAPYPQRCNSCSKEKQGAKQELSHMDITHPKLSRRATAHVWAKPSSDWGIIPFPLLSKEFLGLYQVPFSAFSHPQESSLAQLCVKCHSPIAVTLSEQLQGQGDQLTLGEACSSRSRMLALLSGRGKQRKRKTNINNTAQTISSLVTGRKWLLCHIAEETFRDTPLSNSDTCFLGHRERPSSHPHPNTATCIKQCKAVLYLH